MNPDEFVSTGAALCGVHIVEEDRLAIQLNDVTPLPIGVSSRHGQIHDYMSVVVPQNSLLPCVKSGNYYTVDDFQSSVTFKVGGC